MRSPLHRAPAVLNLIAVQSLLRTLRPLLPLALFAFWLLPTVRPAAAAPVVRAVHATTVSVDLHATTPSVPGWTLGAELELPDHRPPAIPPGPVSASRRPAAWLTALDPTTLPRSRAPIYRVRRSGQAHRSAP